jgi:hypothetical protein
MRVHPDTQRVHESDYGDPDFGGVLRGFGLILLAIVSALYNLFSRRRP